MNKIIEKLKEYDKLYHEESEPAISDSEYDILKDTAKKMYPDNPYFQTVGYPVLLGKVKLPFVLGSLNKEKPETIESWLIDNFTISDKLFASAKLDGVSFIVEYFDGKITFAGTRGDGYIGRDITDKARIFCIDKISLTGHVALRGELTLWKDDYKKLGFKNRRNGAAGIVNRDDMNNCEYLHPFIHEVLYDEKGELGNTCYDKFSKIRDLGFNTPIMSVFAFTGSNTPVVIRTFLDYCREWANDNGIDVDGVVISPLNYIAENIEYPKMKIAYKVNADAVPAIVEHVEWNTTRTGKVIPVVNITPIDIEGVTVSRATGFNAEYIISNNIGKGSEISIVRSGDVIPYIVEVFPDKSIKTNIPDSCPSCGDELERLSVDLICTSNKCVSQKYLAVENYLIKMGTENITRKTLMKLGLDSIQKCYKINEFEISEVVGFGLKSGEMIMNEIQKTRKTTPVKLLSAFGIPNVGKTLSKTILDYMSFDEVLNMERGDIQRKVKGVGDIIDKRIYDHKDRCKELYDDLVSNYGLKFIDNEKGSNNMLNGKVVSLTGKGPVSRTEIMKMVEEAGGIVKGISKSTDILATASPESNSSKMKKAREYGIEIVSYDELMEMC